LVPSLPRAPSNEQEDKIKALFSFSKTPEKMHYAKRRFPVTSNLRYMHGVLNVDEIKN
jgi:hypothetical protein